MSAPQTIIVENLSKRYIIGHQRRSDTLRDAIFQGTRGLWSRLRQRRDEKEDFWALKHVSFEVGQGEVLGVIGRNGAGKSTLLKILSRITEPTDGRIQLRGRVSSLLEVGTGFHPELSGRENIFLNGAILGMSRVEIRQKFDEIVAFAEVERFLDTPVKRYSSGMYVRLAFAVAAHLEPEILIIDEVLAVGDAQFQQKCLGKMRQVATGGRTVLFVSHNMPTVRDLTSRCVLLSGGKVAAMGATPDVLENYAASVSISANSSGRVSTLREIQAINQAGQVQPPLISGNTLRLRVVVETTGREPVTLEFRLNDLQGGPLGFCNLWHYQNWVLPRDPGTYNCELELGLPPMASGRYGLDVGTHVPGSGPDHFLANALIVESNARVNYPTSWDLRKEYHLGHFALTHQIPQVSRQS